MTAANNNSPSNFVAWLSNSAAMKFVRETQSELRKVTWPTREEITRLTIVVVALAVSASIILFAADSLFAWSLLKLQTVVTPR
jgi:preprotein translocase subunit SecE